MNIALLRSKLTDRTKDIQKVKELDVIYLNFPGGIEGEENSAL